MRITARQTMQGGSAAGRSPLDPEVVAGIARQRREGFGWRWDGLGEWTTEAIFSKLRELGGDTTAAQFRAQAQAAGRPSVLCKRWRRGGGGRSDLWEDFPFVAAEALWARLTPDLVCAETIADRLDPLVEAASARNGVSSSESASEGISAAMALIDYLERFPEEQRAERYQEVCDCSCWDYESWLLELVCNCGAKHPDESLRIADIMSGFVRNAMSFQEDVAEMLGRIGRREEAIRRIHRNLERCPGEIQTHIRSGDAYQAMGEFEEALKEFVAAAEMASDEEEWDWAAQRVEDLLAETGRSSEWNTFLREHPRPTEDDGPGA